MRKLLFTVGTCIVLTVPLTFAQETAPNLGDALRQGVESGIRSGVQGAVEAGVQGQSVRGSVREGARAAVQGGVQGTTQYNQNSNPNGTLDGNVNTQANFGNNSANLGATARANVQGPSGQTGQGQWGPSQFASQLQSYTTVGDDGAVRLNADLNNELRQYGFQPNDQILNAQGEVISSQADLQSAFQSDNGQVRVRRGEQIVAIQMPQQNRALTSGEQNENWVTNGESATLQSIGLDVTNGQNGVVVSNIRADVSNTTGLRRGDEIISIDGQRVSSVDDFNNVLNRANQGNAKLVYMRNGQRTGINFPVRANQTGQRNSGNDGSMNRSNASVNGTVNTRLVEQKLQQIDSLVREIRQQLNSPSQNPQNRQ